MSFIMIVVVKLLSQIYLANNNNRFVFGVATKMLKSLVSYPSH
jgi:hypothetical protein